MKNKRFEQSLIKNVNKSVCLKYCTGALHPSVVRYSTFPRFGRCSLLFSFAGHYSVLLFSAASVTLRGAGQGSCCTGGGCCPLTLQWACSPSPAVLPYGVGGLSGGAESDPGGVTSEISEAVCRTGGGPEGSLPC